MVNNFKISDRQKAVGFFILVSGLFWGRFLWMKQALFHDTIFKYFYPWATFFKTCLINKTWPFWNPHVYSGVPFIGNIDSGTFYPSMLLYGLLPYWQALIVITWLHAFLAAWFMYELAKDLGQSQTGSVLAGLIYAFNGFFVSHYAAPTPFQSYAWTPLILLCVRRVLQGRRHYIFIAGAALALQIFSGHPQFVFYSCLILLLYALFQGAVLKGAKARPKFIAMLVGIGILAAIFTAVQLIPTVQFALESVRRAGKGYEWATLYSLKPLELIVMMFVPAWNRFYQSTSGDPNVVSFYFGLVAAVLAAAGFITRARDKKNRWPIHMAAAIALVGFALSLGKYLPFYPFISSIIYPLKIFRMPGQALCVAAFGVSLLAGFGLDQIKIKPKFKAILLFVCVLDLWFFSTRAVQTIDSQFFIGQTPMVDYFQSVTKGDRILLSPRSRAVTARSGHTKLEAALKYIDCVFPNLAMAYNLYDAEGLIELRYQRYEEILDEIGPNPRSTWMNVLNIRYVMSFWDNLPPPFTLIRKDPFFVFENRTALGRAYLVPKALSVPDANFMAYMKANSDHDFRKTVILDGPTEETSILMPKKLKGDVEIELYKPNEVKISVQSSQPCWLVLSDSYDQGWSAQVNGVEAPVMRANHIFRAVKLESGASRVYFSYRPPYFNVGLALSLISIVLALICFATMSLRCKPSVALL